ncbi:MAG: hypothetical protein RL417_1226 [Pseudomonadota bacterium]|jgi:DUF971 family protein
MKVVPTEIKRLQSTGIAITWSDGSHGEISSDTLRRHCPCASCREMRGDTSHSKPLTTPAKPAKPRGLAIVESSLAEETALKEIWAVGQYALGMSWGDGHATGIYTFDLLKDLSSRSPS